jgi:hypothetical protein
MPPCPWQVSAFGVIDFSLIDFLFGFIDFCSGFCYFLSSAYFGINYFCSF